MPRSTPRAVTPRLRLSRAAGERRASARRRLVRPLLASLAIAGSILFGAGASAQVECPLGNAVVADLGDGVVMHTCLWEKAPGELVRAGPLQLVRNGIPILQAQTNRDGKLHGPYLSWDDDGALTSRGTYRDGVKHGAWLIVDERGRQTRLHYLDGRLIGR